MNHLNEQIVGETRTETPPNGDETVHNTVPATVADTADRVEEVLTGTPDNQPPADNAPEHTEDIDGMLQELITAHLPNGKLLPTTNLEQVARRIIHLADKETAQTLATRFCEGESASNPRLQHVLEEMAATHMKYLAETCKGYHQGVQLEKIAQEMAIFQSPPEHMAMLLRLRTAFGARKSSVVSANPWTARLFAVVDLLMVHVQPTQRTERERHAIQATQETFWKQTEERMDLYFPEKIFQNQNVRTLNAEQFQIHIGKMLNEGIIPSVLHAKTALASLHAIYHEESLRNPANKNAQQRAQLLWQARRILDKKFARASGWVPGMRSTNPYLLRAKEPLPTEPKTGVGGPYHHFERIDPVRAMDEEVLERIHFLAGRYPLLQLSPEEAAIWQSHSNTIIALFEQTAPQLLEETNANTLIRQLVFFGRYFGNTLLRNDDQDSQKLRARIARIILRKDGTALTNGSAIVARMLSGLADSASSVDLLLYLQDLAASVPVTHTDKKTAPPQSEHTPPTVQPSGTFQNDLVFFEGIPADQPIRTAEPEPETPISTNPTTPNPVTPEPSTQNPVEQTEQKELPKLCMILGVLENAREDPNRVTYLRVVQKLSSTENTLERYTITRNGKAHQQAQSSAKGEAGLQELANQTNFDQKTLHQTSGKWYIITVHQKKEGEEKRGAILARWNADNGTVCMRQITSIEDITDRSQATTLSAEQQEWEEERDWDRLHVLGLASEQPSLNHTRYIVSVRNKRTEKWKACHFDFPRNKDTKDVHPAYKHVHAERQTEWETHAQQNIVKFAASLHKRPKRTLNGQEWFVLNRSTGKDGNVMDTLVRYQQNDDSENAGSLEMRIIPQGKENEYVPAAPSTDHPVAPTPRSRKPRKPALAGAAS